MHNYRATTTSVSTGTTIIAAKYSDGIIMASDSRLTRGDKGFVVNRVGNKFIEIDDNIIAGCSGAMALAQEITDWVKFSVAFEYSRKRQMNIIGVREVAKEVRERVKQFYHPDNAGVEFIIAGRDEVKGFQIYEIGTTGMLKEVNVATAGSGATYTTTIMDAQYRMDMSESDCIELVVLALKKAIKYDYFSGGVVRLCIMSETKEKKVVFMTKTGTARDDTRAPLLD